MGKELDNSGDTNESVSAESGGELSSTTNKAHTRRRFSRNAMVSGAVLLSLGNRSAWSQTNDVDPACLSPSILNSYIGNTAGGFMMSAHPQNANYTEQLDAKLVGPEMLNRCPDLANYKPLSYETAMCPNVNEGKWVVTEDADKVCVVYQPDPDGLQGLFSNERSQDGWKLEADVLKSQARKLDGTSSTKEVTRSKSRGG